MGSLVDPVVLASALGDVMTYAPATGSPVTIPCTFDAVAVSISAGNTEITTQGPQAWCRLAALPEDPRNPSGAGPVITINALAYFLTDARVDGVGGVLLKLHLAV